MKLRGYEPADCPRLAELFYNTVHTVNAKDYTKEQLDAWAGGNVDSSAWNASFLAHDTLIAEVDGAVVGFGDMDGGGYLDRLYVHRDYQGRGVASALVRALEGRAGAGVSRFSTHASRTARPFFESRGYRVVRENEVLRRGVKLTNFTMEKPREK